jgi:hypothetical protein
VNREQFVTRYSRFLSRPPPKYEILELSMDWVVEVSQGAAGAELSPQAEATAHAAFEKHGCVLLRGAFALATVEAMHRDYVAQIGALDLAAMRAEAAKPPPNRFRSTGEARYDITVRMTGAFGAPETFANPVLLKLLRRLLGRNLRLSSFTLIVAHPGAPQQRAHRDHAHLFDEPEVGVKLPVHAVNLAVPLIDVDIRTGPTGIWLGSHRHDSPETGAQTGPDGQCAWRRGDCLLMDCRTLHADLPNSGAGPRPIVCMVYARPWFFDHGNCAHRSLDMPIERYETLPESVRPLLTRAYSNVMRARWLEVDAGA